MLQLCYEVDLRHVAVARLTKQGSDVSEDSVSGGRDSGLGEASLSGIQGEYNSLPSGDCTCQVGERVNWQHTIFHAGPRV